MNLIFRSMGKLIVKHYFSPWQKFALNGEYNKARDFIAPMPECKDKNLILNAITEMEQA